MLFVIAFRTVNRSSLAGWLFFCRACVYVIGVNQERALAFFFDPR